jgi:hypothetical protein
MSRVGFGGCPLIHITNRTLFKLSANQKAFMYFLTAGAPLLFVCTEKLRPILSK